MTKRFARFAAVGVTAALVLAACGDDDDTSASDTTEMAAEETTTTEAMDDMADDGMADDGMAGDEMAMDIVDTAVEAGSFETLVTAVQAAGLEETLRGDGPFTVFAPTDDAFAALPEGALDSLLADPTGDLASILTYHVVEGEVLAADVVEMDGEEVTTVNGATFTIQVGDDGSVSLLDGAGSTVGVVQTDIETSNGVIHVIDAVLLPG